MKAGPRRRAREVLMWMEGAQQSMGLVAVKRDGAQQAKRVKKLGQTQSFKI